MPRYGPVEIDVLTLFRIMPGRHATEQIRETVFELIELGFLRPGMRLPGVEALAKRLGLSATAVFLALKALAQQGVLVARRRSGYVVGSADAIGKAVAYPHIMKGLAVLRQLGLGDDSLRATIAEATEALHPILAREEQGARLHAKASERRATQSVAQLERQRDRELAKAAKIKTNADARKRKHMEKASAIDAKLREIGSRKANGSLP